MSYDSLAMEPPGALSQEGYDRGPDIVAFRSAAAHWARLAALGRRYFRRKSSEGPGKYGAPGWAGT